MASFAARLSVHVLKADLLELGFEKKKVAKFVTAPYHVGHTQTLLKSYAPPNRKPRKGRYINLCLRKASRNQRWVVYDPSKHLPVLQDDMLRLIVKFAIYQPGNPRFLEFNTRTQSLRIRSSRILAGQQISYTANGPVLQPLELESDFESEASIKITKRKKGVKPLSPPKKPDDSDSELTELESEDL